MAGKAKVVGGPGRGEQLLTVAILFVLTKSFFSAAESSWGFSIREDSPSGRILLLLVYGTTLRLMASHVRVFLRIVRADLLIGALVCLALLSAVWSTNPYISFRNGIFLIATTLVGVYLAGRYPLRKQLELAGIALGIAAVLSLLYGLAVPSLGIGESNWRGVFNHKNTLGRTMALAVIVLGYRSAVRGRHRWLAVAGTALALMLVVLSRSGTAVIVLAALGLLLVLYASFRAQVYLAVALASALLLTGGVSLALMLGNLSTVLGMLGKDVTLTGRAALWGAVLGLIRSRPWLGYGYEAFWFGAEDQVQDVWHIAGWFAGGAHNGFLEIALALGILGLAVFCLHFVLSFGMALRGLRNQGSAEAIWPPIFLSFFFFYNLTESSLLMTNSILWALYVATTLTIRRQPGQDETGTPAPRLKRLVLQGERRHGEPYPNGSRVPQAWR